MKHGRSKIAPPIRTRLQICFTCNPVFNPSVKPKEHKMPPEPIRCFHGNAQPHEPFWTFRNASETESGQTELEIYGPISEFSWWGDEVTPKMFKDELYRRGNSGPVTVRLN